MSFESSAQYESLNFSRLHSIPKAAFRLFLFVIWLCIALLTQTIFLRLNLPIKKTWPKVLHRVFAYILGIEVVIRGKIYKKHPCLYVANHSSYADIFVLGGFVKGSFIAKKEIASWPIFGYLTSLQESIFVERKREHAAKQSEEVKKRLLEGDNLMVFPEGTSSDGNGVLPFKSSLFALVQNVEGLAIQPISISYVQIDGIPMGTTMRPLVAWYGDMTLLPHLWKLLGLGKIKAIIDFNQPLIHELKTMGRKEIAAVTREAIAHSHDRALHEPVEIKMKKQKHA